MRGFVGPYAIEVEKFFEQVLFNYLVLNGDAHLKNFSLYRVPGQSIHILTPAYDLLNTRFHLPNEAGDTALDLFKGGFATESFKANAFYAKDDFVALGRNIGIRKERVLRAVEKFATRFDQCAGLLKRSFLGGDSSTMYIELVAARIRRFKYSYPGSRKKR